MGESVRRRKYRYDRVLIETDRVLNPQFDDAVVYLTGAQIEMLRNVSQYLNRLDTYVTEYNPGYYIAPTAVDYDAILEIVADLEETLMGNPNTIWGYKEPLRFAATWANASPGTHELSTDAIPAGSVARLEGLAWRNDTTIMDRVIVTLKSSFVHYPLVDIADPAAGVWHIYSFDRTIEAGGLVQFEMQGCIQDDGLDWQIVGRLMDVPE